MLVEVAGSVAPMELGSPRSPVARVQPSSVWTGVPAACVCPVRRWCDAVVRGRAGRGARAGQRVAHGNGDAGAAAWNPALPLVTELQPVAAATPVVAAEPAVQHRRGRARVRMEVEHGRRGGGYGVGGERLFFTDGGPTVAGTNPAVVAVFARALTTFSQIPR